MRDISWSQNVWWLNKSCFLLYLEFVDFLWNKKLCVYTSSKCGDCIIFAWGCIVYFWKFLSCLIDAGKMFCFLIFLAERWKYFSSKVKEWFILIYFLLQDIYPHWIMLTGMKYKNLLMLNSDLIYFVTKIFVDCNLISNDFKSIYTPNL